MVRILLALVLLPLVSGCVGIPANVQAVNEFDAGRYVGTWYEIARLENSFEAGLEKVTAQYTPRTDGGLRVVNRGYDPKNGRRKVAEGKAYFVGSRSQGRLKVSFFGPFYGAYNIICLDENYGHALVCGSDYGYLWILSKTPSLPEPVIHDLVRKAKELGFQTDQLVFVKH